MATEDLQSAEGSPALEALAEDASKVAAELQADAPAVSAVEADAPAVPPGSATRTSGRITGPTEVDELLAEFFAEALGNNKKTNASMTMEYYTTSRKLSGRGWKNALRGAEEEPGETR